MKRLMLSGLIAFSVWQSLAFADDTDIYLKNNNAGNAPYLMLMFDYRSNMSETFCSASGNNSCTDALADHPDLLEALEGIAGAGQKATVVQAVMAVFQVVFAKFEGIHVGLMMPNYSQGGTIIRGFELFGPGEDDPAKQGLIEILKSIPVDDVKGGEFHDVRPVETYYELWRYLNGLPVSAGHSTADNFAAGVDPNGPLALSAPNPYYDPSIVDTPNDSSVANDEYFSPFDDPNADYSCTKLYSVYATAAKKNDDKNPDLSGMTNDAIDDFSGMVSFLANNDLVEDVAGDQSLKTWFIQMGNGNESLTEDWAARAGTSDQVMLVNDKVNLEDLQATLEAAFIEALSESTTFVSASVPVNVFNRIQTLDNFFIALFEANATERWPGNVKKLRLVDTGGGPNGELDGKYDDIVDVNDDSAFSEEDGRIYYDRLTYWTDAARLPPADVEEGEINGMDGRVVDRGGAGQQIPGFYDEDSLDQRQVYVEPATAPTDGTPVNFDPFNADADTADALKQSFGNGVDADEALALIKWGRGMDVDDEDQDNDTEDARDWILGDAIHSRPLALNYGATDGYDNDNPNIRLFMGTNDGFFHVFENTTTTGAESGKEIFAFIPRESLPVLKQLRDNQGDNDHPYGVDGEPVALVVDDDADGTVDAEDEVYVYVGMRRGGKSYYALDASDPDAAPEFQWKITQTDGGDFDELGLTFSTPRVAKVRFDDTGPRDVLIFAGGYDTNKDSDDGRGLVADIQDEQADSRDSEGNAIYIVDARTGELIWKAVDGLNSATDTVFYHEELNDSIPSTVATLDANGNGVVDRAYVGDTGGKVWRIDLPEGKTENHRRDNWEITKLADLGDDTDAGDRRFFHAPDVVQTRDDHGHYDGILIQSGDRANPLEIADDNYLYLIKDRDTYSGSPPDTTVTHASLPDTTDCVTGDEDGCGDAMDYSAGWKLQLAGEGEKGLSSPITADGEIYSTTYRPQPSNDSCAPQEGTGALYEVNLKDGTAVSPNGRFQDIGPGIPPDVTALSDSTLIVPGTGKEVFNEDGESEGTEKLVETHGKNVYIIYWREPGEDKL